MKKRILYLGTGFLLVFVLHAAFSMGRAAKISSQWVGLEDASPFRLYLGSQDYFMGLSYGLAAGFTLYALSRFLADRKGGLKGVIGGMTLTGTLYLAACFLSGCCGSPMLPIYLGLFGASFLGFAKPLNLLLTLISVGIGFVWMERRKKMADGKGCCQAEGGGIEISFMPSQAVVGQIRSDLQQGMGLAKCRRCGCMKGALEDLRSAFSALQTPETRLLDEVRSWLEQMEPIQYPCLGCQHCFPAEALNFLHQTPWAAAELVASDSGSAPDLQERTWPPAPGEYFVLGDGPDRPVAVSTLASVELAEKLANVKPRGLCLVGKTETENIGLEKIIKNTITNPAIRFLLLAGVDPAGHHSGRTLLALGQNGVDDKMRVVGSPGRRSILKNVTRQEVEDFRGQVEVVDLMGYEDVHRIVAKVEIFSQRPLPPICRREKGIGDAAPTSVLGVPVIQATAPKRVELDPGGYFVIIPQPGKVVLVVEHYSNDNMLLHVVEGQDPKALYGTIIENGWLTQLSHAAYLGKELERAALSMRLGLTYTQDGA